jgi:hypothetical protein
MTNDQGHIIEALKEQRYNYVWEKIKYVGFRIFPDISERYTYFGEIVTKFDPNRNNNFIQFYLDRLTNFKGYCNDTYYVTSNRTIIHNLRNENISPTECKYSKLTRDLKGWN